MRGFFSGRLQPSTVAKENTGGLKTPATSIVIFTVNAMNPIDSMETESKEIDQLDFP